MSALFGLAKIIANKTTTTNTAANARIERRFQVESFNAAFPVHMAVGVESDACPPVSIIQFEGLSSEEGSSTVYNRFSSASTATTASAGGGQTGCML